MSSRGWPMLVGLVCAWTWGCGGATDIDLGSTSSSPGGSSAGGSSAGGSASGGSGAGGNGGAGAGGQGGTAGDGFWPAPYDPTGTPDPANGEHNAGKDCLTCHNPTGPGNEELWLYGGTVFRSDKTTPAPHVEVGVAHGSATYTTYSGSNGNFWYPAGPNIDWSAVTIKMRNEHGEKQMNATATGGGCNSCHTGEMAIVEP